ncbi:MAG: hypothetical protein HQL54_07740 [Magnetococcales bacterium]|nr:hypothetical protein [Magnetococcales bacterium]
MNTTFRKFGPFTLIVRKSDSEFGKGGLRLRWRLWRLVSHAVMGLGLRWGCTVAILLISNSSSNINRMVREFNGLLFMMGLCSDACPIVNSGISCISALNTPTYTKDMDSYTKHDGKS